MWNAKKEIGFNKKGKLRIKLIRKKEIAIINWKIVKINRIDWTLKEYNNKIDKNKTYYRIIKSKERQWSWNQTIWWTTDQNKINIG